MDTGGIKLFSLLLLDTHILMTTAVVVWEALVAERTGGTMLSVAPKRNFG